MTELQVGVARADVTPPVGTPSIGFAARGPLTALHDPLLATAMVLSDGERTGVLITCDLIGLDAETTAEVRAGVSERTGIPGKGVTIACSHTHYGPDPGRDRSHPMVVAYHANLVYTLVGVVEEAMADLRPAAMGVGWGESYIGINRREKLPDGRVILGRNPDGPTDRAVGVLRIEELDGRPIACVVNFQTHPVAQTGTVAHISADYPGQMRRVVEELTGARCLFLQGACGDINAAIMEPCYESARTLGVRLGCEVVRVWETICPAPARELRFATTTVALPRIRYGSPEEARTLLRNVERELEARRAEGAAPGLISWLEKRLTRARDALASWDEGRELEPVMAELQAWQIGPCALATAPGEIFNQIGTQVKAASPFKDTFFVAYANGYIGYVPTPDAYDDGGYEVLHASQVDPDAAGMIVEGCLGLLGQLSKEDHRDSR